MNKIRDGDLYKIVELYGRRFELRYGYYEEFERESGEPVPILPNFKDAPVYTEDGFPFVTQMQELCEHGESQFKEGCCADCRYYRDGEDLIGVCDCPENRRA